MIALVFDRYVVKTSTRHGANFVKKIKIGLRRFAEARLNYKQLPHYLDVHLQNRLTFGVHLIFKSVSNSNNSKYLSDMLPQ